MGGSVVEFENIKELVSLIDDSSLTEFEYVQDGTALRLSKNTTPSFSKEAVIETKVETTATEQVAPKQETVVVNTESTVVAAKEGKVITSPIVGVVYLQANPESDAYVSEGDQVSEGQVVCLVEAMKIMNEIKSEHTGKVVEILVENESIVEYNQPLFRIV